MRGKPSPALPSPHFVAVLSATPSAGVNPPQRPLNIFAKKRYSYYRVGA